jgi:hypothetical protein
MMAQEETHSAQSALARTYAPAPKLRVGILLVADALSGPESSAAVDAALLAAGHTPLRRRASLQTRVGEAELRLEDVLEFIQDYGHEYAVVAFRPWPAAQGHEAELTAAATEVGCRTIWDLTAGAPIPEIDAALGDVVLR